MFTLENDGFVARITMHRPAARNAVAPDQWALLAQVAQEAGGVALADDGDHWPSMVPAAQCARWS